MDWCYPASDNEQREMRKHKYAAKYLWGIDFEQRAAKTSRALMLIAGDGHTNIFGPDVSSLDPRTWYENASGQALMHGLRQAKLTAKKIPEGEMLKDEDKAWEYFDELKFDVILANPPFAGEMKDRKMLVRYELAKPALKRAGDDKQPKEERDVLFIERILKMLKPGGRAAIVLPQGKFNNSSLAFIREWILKKARLLAVVGLHPNTFKPHTGTKTSVLFVQKYTQEQLEQIAKVHDKVAGACPDYEAELKTLLTTHQEATDVPEDAIPEAVADLIAERFTEPESEEAVEDNGQKENGEGSDEASATDEDRASLAEEKLTNLKTALVKAKQKLMNLESDEEALQQQQEQEVEIVTSQWKGEKTALRLHVKEMRQTYKVSAQKLKDAHKALQKATSSEIKALEKQIPDTEIELKLLSNRGKLTLILEDAELIGTLKDRWIAGEVAKQLDYPIFMAVSERGGKDNSGDYKHVLDEQGSLVEFPDGHPQEGQLVVDQDLVNYNLRPADLADAGKIPVDKLCVAEAFVRFAQAQKFAFWEND
jgi:type I restriction enzyme M protein